MRTLSFDILGPFIRLFSKTLQCTGVCEEGSGTVRAMPCSMAIGVRVCKRAQISTFSFVVVCRVVERKSETDRISYEKFISDEQREMGNTEPHKQNLKACIDLVLYLMTFSLSTFGACTMTRLGFSELAIHWLLIMHAQADFKLTNDSTLEDFHKQIEQALTKMTTN